VDGRLTEVGVPVVDLDPDAPWYWVLLLRTAENVKKFWYRGDPRQIFDAAVQTDIRTVEVRPVEHVNEWRRD
jgi:hypothetical protein